MAFDLDDQELEATRRLHGVGKKDIEVGEWIRTYKGHIDKIVIAEKEDDMYAGENDPEYLDYTSKNIKRHSHQLIDLIEVGDYVNGELVTQIIGITDKYTEEIIGKKLATEYRTAQYTGLDNRYYIHATQIKSIVTHEQFNNIKYIVKEK